jgi:hypothetical protein
MYLWSAHSYIGNMGLYKELIGAMCDVGNAMPVPVVLCLKEKLTTWLKVNPVTCAE